ncbi:unnamed protein product, partial [Brachionus calyciflorus]
MQFKNRELAAGAINENNRASDRGQQDQKIVNILK